MSGPVFCDHEEEDMKVCAQTNAGGITLGEVLLLQD